MTRQRRLWTLLAGGALLGAVGCNETRDTGAVTTRTPEGVSRAPAAETAERRDVAMVRVINAIPGSDRITVWAGDSIGFAFVEYKGITDWREIPDDRFTFQIKPTAEAEPLAENRENLQGGGHYTIVALPGEGEARERNLRVLDDDLKPVSADKARVRFINGVPGDTDVDLLISGREDALFDGVNFTHEGGWNEVDPISGTLSVRPDNERTTLASMANAKLEAGKSYTFVLVGTPGKYELLKIEDNVAKDPRQNWDANDTRERVEP